jgi:hypothetical protein
MVMRLAKSIGVVNLVMLSILFQRLVGLEAVCIEYGPLSRLVFDLIHESLGSHIRDNSRVDFTVAFQDAEYDGLIVRSSASFAFSPASEIAFVQFKLSIEFVKLCIEIIRYPFPEEEISLHHCPIADAKFLGGLVCGNFEIEVEENIEIRS